MKEIPLTKGYIALVDDADYDWLMQWKWYPLRSRNYNRVSAVCRISGRPNRKTAHMHRLIMGNPSGLEVDHINHNALDNTRDNLRLCTHSENMANQLLSSSSTTGFKGVSYYKKYNNWQARIKVHQKSIFLGYYDSASEAANKYDESAILYFGDCALTNKSLGLL